VFKKRLFDAVVVSNGPVKPQFFYRPTRINYAMPCKHIYRSVYFSRPLRDGFKVRRISILLFYSPVHAFWHRPSFSLFKVVCYPQYGPKSLFKYAEERSIVCYCTQEEKLNF